MATAAKKKPSTAVAVKSSGALVDVRAMMSKDLAALNDRVAPPSGDKVQVTQDKHFKLPDGTKTPGPLEVVIVDFISKNSFYEGAFDPNNIVPPACFAIGEVPTAMVPSENSPVKQASACASCPMNQFGSAGNGKACKNARSLAILPPDADAETPVWILDVSPTGLKPFDSYVTSIARQFQVPPVGVVTEVSFDPNVTYASLRFKPIRPLSDSELAAFYGRKEEAMKRLVVEPDVSGYDNKPPAKKPATRGRR